jgi:hypothetical protein
MTDRQAPDERMSHPLQIVHYSSCPLPPQFGGGGSSSSSSLSDDGDDKCE